MRSLLGALVTLVYPDRCAACDAFLSGFPGLCESCAQSLYPVGAACPTCAEPAERSLVCAACRVKPPPFGRAIVPWRYGGELAVALRRFKYGGPNGSGRLDLARPLGALLGPFAVDAVAGVDVVVPVPLSPRRLRTRGFSQAQALAEQALAAIRGRPALEPFALVRVRDTAEQAGLGRSARIANVRGAFRARGVDGKRVLLVDDVVTTGATAAAAAGTLRAAGATRVDVLALARAES